MNILVLTRHSSMGASSRMRFYQYFPFLAERGCSITVAPLFGDDAYLRRFYIGKGRPAASIIRGYMGRILNVFRMRRFDIVWLEKEFLPWFPRIIEKACAAQCSRLVIDFDDAIFHNYDLHPNPLVRGYFGGKIADIIRRSSAVIAGNSYLAQYAQRAGARRVEILPTVVDPERYTVRETPADAGKGLCIGWIGSPVTEKYLAIALPAMETIAREIPLRLVTIGAARVPQASFPVEKRQWSLATETVDIADFDVGIMPLSDAPWERGKCGYKLIQYMAAGKPVVASRVGVNETIVNDNGVCGFIADTADDWVRSLRTLCSDPGLRQKYGATARKKVESYYSVRVQEQRLWKVFNDLQE
jgi:glycosyltransferase involved in cell wall biosynthesis